MTDQVLQDIKDRLDIVEVIGSYIPLKKSGTNFKAVCPFHNESTASLMVSPQKQIWHCFGCGEGGDVFGFVMRYENIEFREALKMMAERAGIELPAFQRPANAPPDISGELIRVNNFAAKFYHQVLRSPAGDAALKYLHDRGLTEATLDQWQIGFAPDDFHALERALAQKQVKPELMVQAGVSVKNDNGQVYDRFRNRITFPIFNYFGEVAGFTARILSSDDKQQAKYVNSPETDIYNKSRILFGLNFAKESIRKKDEVVVVEGQLDVIQAHQAGFTNVVASSGTALTEQQLVMLGRLTKNLKFCFDADTAGSNATRRAGELALQQGFRLKIINLKNVKDPDDLIRQSPGLWQKAVHEAVWFIDFYLERASTGFEAGSVEQKHYLSEEVLPLLRFIADPLEQDHYIHSLSTDFMVSESVIREQLKKTSPFPAAARAVSLPPPAPPGTPGAVAAVLEKQVVGGLLSVPDFLAFVREQGLDDDEISNPNLRQLARTALEGTLVESAVNQDTLAKEAVFMVESELDNLNNNELAFLRELKKSLFMLKLNDIKRRQQELTVEIKKAEDQKNPSKIEELNKKFAHLATLRVQVETQLQ
jgi:DNA primase